MKKQETKKILYIITKSNWGGAQRYVYDMATEVSKKNFDVSVILGGNGVLKERLDTKHIPTISLTSLQRDVHLLNDFKVFTELRNIYKQEKPDVVHLNSSKIGILGALAARMTHVPTIVFTAHGWAHTEDRPWYQKKIIKFLHWLTIILSHTTIAVSEQTRKELADTPFVSKKLVTVYNGVTPPNLFKKDYARKILCQNKQLPEDAVVLGTIAELHTNKGLSYAIEACEKIMQTTQNFFFIIIGSGEKEAELKTLVEEKGLSDHILFFESSEANRYLSAYDVFILPSIKEGLPYTILEAGCAHLPVIASKIGGIPEIIKHDSNGLLITPRSVEEISLAISTLIHNQLLREKLGTALYTDISKKFSTRAMVENTFTYYN